MTRALEPGDWGEIGYQVVSAGVVRARARQRGFDGRVRLVERSSTSKRAARKVLEAAMEEYARSGGSWLTSRSTFAEAYGVWLADLEQLGRLGERSPTTLETYARVWQAHVLPGLGALPLSQVTTPTVDRFLLGLAERVGPATAKTARTIVSGVTGRMVREGVMLTNPTRETRSIRAKPKRRPRALTESERAAWFLALARDERAHERDLVDLSAFMLATGLRIGEVLAVIWAEVDLEAPTVSVTSTVVRVKGQGLLRKATKTDSGARVLVLPAWCVSMLARRAAVGVGADEPVFPTIRGTFREPRTVTMWLKEARDGFDGEVDLSWVTSHSWRKTTATVLDEQGLSARMIADQLGHSRVSMTQDVYLGRRLIDPRLVLALEGVDPTARDGQSDGSGGVDHGA